MAELALGDSTGACTKAVPYEYSLPARLHNPDTQQWTHGYQLVQLVNEGEEAATNTGRPRLYFLLNWGEVGPHAPHRSVCQVYVRLPTSCQLPSLSRSPHARR